MTLDITVRKLAERQHGVVGVAQAYGLGASRAELRRRCASSDGDAPTPRVLRLAGSTRTYRQRCMVAVLDAGPGACLSLIAADALWRLPGFPSGPTELNRMRAPPGGLGRTSAAAARAPPDHGAPRARHDGRSHDRGPCGCAVFRADRAGVRRRPGPRPALPLRQRELGGEEWIGRVDFLCPEKRLVVEIDRALHHSTLSDESADADRDRALHEAGYRVVRIGEQLVWHRPQEVVRRLLAS